MSPTRVLVTGVGGGGVGEQVVKALSLAKTDYVVHGTDISDESLGFESVDRAHVVPRAAEPTYMDRILALCVSESIDVLIPGSEAELITIGRERSRIEEIGVFLPVNPASVLDICMDKFKTNDWLARHGYSVPRTWQIESIADLSGVDAAPAVLKPGVGGGGSANVLLAQSLDEAHALGRYLLDTIGSFVVQEYVGTIDSEFTVGVLLDMDGHLVDSIALKRDLGTGLSSRIRVRNRSTRHDLGESLVVSSGVSQGHVDRYPAVTEECERIAVELGARGAVNLQCRLWNGRPYIFEINPRFSGTTSIRAMVGFNEPDWLIRRHVLGESLSGRLDYRSGTVLRGLHEGRVVKGS